MPRNGSSSPVIAALKGWWMGRGRKFPPEPLRQRTPDNLAYANSDDEVAAADRAVKPMRGHS